MSLSRGELGDGLGAFRDGVLGKLTGEDEADSGLDLAGSESGLLVNASELQEGIGGEMVRQQINILRSVVNNRQIIRVKILSCKSDKAPFAHSYNSNHLY